MKKTLSITAVFSLLVQLVLIHGAVFASQQDEKRTSKVKASILKLGTGRDARTEVKLTDNRKIAGFIKESNDSQFVIENLKTGASETVIYSQVKSVKGKNLSTGAKILIGLGIAAGVFLFISVLFDD